MGCYVESRKNSPGAVNLNQKKSNYCKLEYVIVRFIGNSLGHAADGVSRPYYFFAGLLNSNSERSNSSAVGIIKYRPFVQYCILSSFCFPSSPFCGLYFHNQPNSGQFLFFWFLRFFFLSLILMGLNTNYQVTCHAYF